MVYDEIACDYNYKCLSHGMITDGHTVPCPHLQSCTVFKRIQKYVKAKSVGSSYKKKKKGWDHTNIRPQDLRDLFAESLRDGFVCPYCNNKMTLEIGYSNQVSIDHVIARGLGGDNSKANMILCCKSCNRDKAIIELKYVKARS